MDVVRYVVSLSGFSTFWMTKGGSSSIQALSTRAPSTGSFQNLKFIPKPEISYLCAHGMNKITLQGVVKGHEKNLVFPGIRCGAADD
jgi:hypothetical protein